MQETWVWSLGWEYPLKKGMATHSSILAWRIPWTEEPGGLQSMGWQRVRHNWTIHSHTHTHTHTRIFRVGFPWWLSGKDPPSNSGDGSLIPGSGRSPGGGNGNLLQYSCLGNPSNRRSLTDYCLWGLKRLRHNFWLKKQQYLGSGLSDQSPIRARHSGEGRRGWDVWKKYHGNSHYRM